MQMKLILTCYSDCKPPLTVVTFRLLTIQLRVKLDDGGQVLELSKLPVEKILNELSMADMRLVGHQHSAFHEYKDTCGNRLFAALRRLPLFN